MKYAACSKELYTKIIFAIIVVFIYYVYVESFLICITRF